MPALVAAAIIGLGRIWPETGLLGGKLGSLIYFSCAGVLGLVVALPLAFFQPDGGWKLLGLVLLVKIVVQNIEGWFLTPQIMGHRTGLHPVAIIVAIFRRRQNVTADDLNAREG